MISVSYKIEPGHSGGKQEFLWSGNVALTDTPTVGQKALLSLQVPWLGQMHTGSYFLKHSFPARFTRKLRNNSFTTSCTFRPWWFISEALVVQFRANTALQRQAVACSPRRTVPASLPALQFPRLIPLKSPQSHFCGRFHWVSQGLLEEGR